MRRAESVATFVTAGAAVVVALAAVSRLSEADRTAGPPLENRPSLVSQELWREAVALGRPLGDSGALAKVVVLSDFECPACRSFHSTVIELLDRLPDSIDVRYVHTPLPYHRFALPAARVSECAARYGRFKEAVDRLFAAQDSFGLVRWSQILSFGMRSGSVIDFDACATGASPEREFDRISRGVDFGRRLGMEGTPTVLVNGLRFDRPPNPDALVAVIRK